MGHRAFTMGYGKLFDHIMQVLLASHTFGIKKTSENELNVFQMLLLCLIFCLNAVWWLDNQEEGTAFPSIAE